MALTDKLTAIADAIRAKTGGTAALTLPQMAAAIADLPDPMRSDSFCQVNTVVKDYLDNAAYTANDYSVSVVSDYASRSVSYHKTRPFGYEVTLSDSGTLHLCDFGSGNILKTAVSAGSYTVSNLTPNAGGCYLLIKDGQMVQGGLLFPSGALRMIYADDLINVRDLGGWACDGGTVKYGKLFRGCEFTGNALIHNQITETGKRVMTDLLGVSYECDLRWDEETYGTDQQPGTDDDIVSSALGDSVEYRRFPIYYYLNGVQLGTPSVEITKNCLLYVMEQAIKEKTGYFHCMYGRDRTGTLACILLALLGVAQTDIDKDYELTTFIGIDSGLTAYRNSNNWVQMMTYFNGFSGSTFRDKVVNWAFQLGIPADTLNAFRAAVIDGTPDIIIPPTVTYTVTESLSNVTITPHESTVDEGDSFSATLTPVQNYGIKEVVVTMGGVNITSAAYSNGVVSISSVTGNIVITASGYYAGNYLDLVGYDADCRLGTSDGTTRAMAGSIAVKAISFSRDSLPTYEITGVDITASWANILALYDAGGNYYTYINLNSLSQQTQKMQEIGFMVSANGNTATITVQEPTASSYNVISQWRICAVGNAENIDIREVI